MVIDWSKLMRHRNTVVHCTTREEAEALAVEFVDRFPEKDIDLKTLVRWWRYHRDKTCYNLRLYDRTARPAYSHFDHYDKEGYSIVGYANLIAEPVDFGSIDADELSIEFLFGTLEVAE